MTAGLDCCLLIHLCECTYVQLERLIVLAFNLQFSLQLFHLNFQARNLDAQFLDIRGCSCCARRGIWSRRGGLGSSRIALLYKRLGQRARPDVVCRP